MQILPPASCTASVTRRWRATSRGLDSLPAKGLAQPARFGAMPPLTSRPAPPRARAAKYAASLREVARAILEPGVHRTHDDAIGEAREAQIERGKQVPVFHAPECSV